MNYRCIPVPYKNVKAFAALIEKHINELLEQGYDYQIVQITGRPDVVIHARKSQGRSLLDLLRPMTEETTEQVPEAKCDKSHEFSDSLLAAVSKGSHRGADDADIIANKVRTLDSLSVEIRQDIAHDLEEFASFTEKNHVHRDGKECWMPRTLRAAAKEVRERIKATQS